MIWTDWGTSPKIEKAALNGNQRTAIVTSYLYWPNGIELDRGNQRVFWVDAYYGRLESVTYHGNNRILHTSIRGFHAFGLSMIAPLLFLTDWTSKGPIHTIDAATGNYVISNYVTSGRPMGIVAYDSSRQPPGTFVHSLTHSLACSLIHSFIHPSIHPSVHPSTTHTHTLHSFIHPFILKKIHLFIHSFTH